MYRNFRTVFFLSFFLLISKLLPAENTPKVIKPEKKQSKIGEFTFKYKSLFTLNKIRVNRNDTVTLSDEKFPEGLLFIVAPVKVVGSSVDKHYAETLKDDIARAFVKSNSSRFEWKAVYKSTQISNYETEQNRFLGWNGSVLILLDVRTVCIEKKCFVIGQVREQERGRTGQENFDEGFLVFPFGLELDMAILSSSITGEPEPMMWPPLGNRPGGVASPSTKKP